MGSATAAAFFIRFWQKTRDLLFLAFALAFLIEAGNRIAMLWLTSPDQGTPGIYLLRLISYVIILAAIVNKNRA